MEGGGRCQDYRSQLAGGGLWGDLASAQPAALFEQTIIGRSYLSICLILDSFSAAREQIETVFPRPRVNPPEEGVLPIENTGVLTLAET